MVRFVCEAAARISFFSVQSRHHVDLPRSWLLSRPDGQGPLVKSFQPGKMTIHNLYIFDRHCECIYFQKWSHQRPASTASVNATSTTSSKTGGLLNSTSRYSTSSATSNVIDSNVAHSSAASSYKAGDDSNRMSSMQSAVVPGNSMSLEEEAKLVYGVVLSLRNFVRKLSGRQVFFSLSIMNDIWQRLITKSTHLAW